MNGLPKYGHFIGTGWAFPPAFTAGGADVAMAQDEQDIMESLQILLATSLGERVMREDYGCNLRDYLFEELDQRLLSNLRLAVADSIRLHETRIETEDIRFDVQADFQQSVIYIRIGFRVRTTNSRYNMVYPFYLTESTLGPAGATAPPSRTQVPAQVGRYGDLGTGIPDDTSGTGGHDTETAIQFAAFLHRPTTESTANWTRNYSILDDERLNGKPEAIFFVTPLWGIENEGGPTRDAIEIGYLKDENRWAIFSKNPLVQMKAPDTHYPFFFYVLIAPEAAVQGEFAFVHRATAENCQYNRTVIQNKHADNRPDAYLLTTTRRSAHTNHETCVEYFADGIDKWAVANAVADGNASSAAENQMMTDSEFNVLILPGKNLGNLRAFSHQATPNNIISSGGTWLDNALINGKQHIYLFFTQAWRPEYSPQQGAHCPYHCQGWFNSLTDIYAIYKRNHWIIWPPSGNIPPGTVFNVFVHTDI